MKCSLLPSYLAWLMWPWCDGVASTFPHRNYVGPKKLMWLKAFTVCCRWSDDMCILCSKVMPKWLCYKVMLLTVFQSDPVLPYHPKIPQVNLDSLPGSFRAVGQQICSMCGCPTVFWTTRQVMLPPIREISFATATFAKMLGDWRTLGELGTELGRSWQMWCANQWGFCANRGYSSSTFNHCGADVYVHIMTYAHTYIYTYVYCLVLSCLVLYCIV